ncbi:ABC transporter substrate-binding protein [Vreelandella titanicae]|jgi:iron complex transport system substrate-binding protein|uniref:ABC transporter, periplasmic binding protein n=1 Tax=Vreelandella titanicae BH1 TaxID=1204738 RepID=L9UCP3_9GAMM|nr:ABC transporter substrate-binding protein [Halomonas titanicae]ELY22745.1 ABC transporter, periplasmic binding protein [Halomonas titanicae BH1]NVE89031.1 ABC transporter substrate-binding protein [Halomonas titanicae]|tara:strand:+ start:223 stop:1122 length:900 start_codon:yes stop_codon:yes gene_type:complete
MCHTNLFSLLARCGLFAVCMLSVSTAQAQWATVDWTIAETLLAIDAPVSSVAQQSDYHAWVGEPRIPDSATDMGLRTQPNMELLAQVPPEQTLISPMFAGLTPRLERIAPVTSFSLYSPGTDTWQEMQTLTRQLGELTERQPQAEQLIEDTQTLMATLRESRPLSQSEIAPLLMVQFMDARHVRVFGENSLYNAVLEQLDLPNAWDQSTNAWGFALVGIEALARYPEVTMVIIDPLPAGAEEKLAKSGLWQQLPSVRHDRIIHLPPVWSFGALPSAQRFARKLTTALEAAPSVSHQGNE